MYIERKANETTGEARIGRVNFSKTGRTMYYDGKEFAKVKDGIVHNCIELESGEAYWISGCKKNGTDRLYGNIPVYIDKDIREEYWTIIRNQPELKLKETSN